MNEYDEDTDLVEQDEASTGFEGLPAATQKELKKLRKEAAALRGRLEERDEQVLSARYGDRIVGMIPQEVTSFDRRVELAETYKESLAPPAVKETEDADPPGLAMLAGPSRGLPGMVKHKYTVAEIKEIAKTDPAEADRLILADKFEHQEQW